MKKIDVSAIRNLSSFAKETKIGRVRSILGDIEDLISFGVSYKRIVDELNSQGFEISLSHFGTIISILRKQRSKEKSSTGIVASNISIPFKQKNANNSQELNKLPSTEGTNLSVVIGDVSLRLESKQPGEPKKFNWEELKKIESNWD